MLGLTSLQAQKYRDTDHGIQPEMGGLCSVPMLYAARLINRIAVYPGLINRPSTRIRLMVTCGCSTVTRPRDGYHGTMMAPGPVA